MLEGNYTNKNGNTPCGEERVGFFNFRASSILVKRGKRSKERDHSILRERERFFVCLFVSGSFIEASRGGEEAVVAPAGEVAINKPGTLLRGEVSGGGALQVMPRAKVRVRVRRRRVVHGRHHRRARARGVVSRRHRRHGRVGVVSVATANAQIAVGAHRRARRVAACIGQTTATARVAVVAKAEV